MLALLWNGLSVRNAVAVGAVAFVGAIASQAPAEVAMATPAQVSLELEESEPIPSEVTGEELPEAKALDEAVLGIELPEELEDLREMGEQVGDLLGGIDPEVIKAVMRPLGRQALRVFLNSAPGLSQKAIELGEQGLEELERRATEGLEQAEERFELDVETDL